MSLMRTIVWIDKFYLKLLLTKGDLSDEDNFYGNT